ncbi:MAG: hypothetical protein ACK4UN_13550 [Limisphaerales bacterium]
MKVLLKNQRTNLFAREDGNWIGTKEEAADFRTPLNAMNYCFLHHLSDVSLVVATDGREHEMPLRCEE